MRYQNPFGLAGAGVRSCSSVNPGKSYCWDPGQNQHLELCMNLHQYLMKRGKSLNLCLERHRREERVLSVFAPLTLRCFDLLDMNEMHFGV